MPATPPPPRPAIPPREPVDLFQQRVDEEIACMRTMCATLGASLAAYRDEGRPVGELLPLPELREFFDLLASLVESDRNIHRLRVLVLDTRASPLRVLLDYAQTPAAALRPRGDAADRFSEQGWGNVRVQSVQTITRVIGVCCAAAEAEAERGSGTPGEDPVALFEWLSGTGCVDALMRLLTLREGEGCEALRVASAECLYVCISKVGEAREAVVRLRAVPFLCDLLWKETAAMVRNYLCAMLRAVSGDFAEQLLDTQFVHQAVQSLQHEESKYVAILLLDILAHICREYPSFYLSRVVPVPGLVQSLCRLCESVLHRNAQADIVVAVVGLIEVVAEAEGRDRGRTAFLCQLFCGDAWKSLLFGFGREQLEEAAGVADGVKAAAAKISCYRRCVAACTTAPLVAALAESLEGSSAGLGVLLSAPMEPRLPPEHSAEAGLTLLLAAAKSPRVRTAARAVLQPYPQWREALRLRLCEVMHTQEGPAWREVFTDTPIIDASLAYLNNPLPVEAAHGSGVAWWGDFASVAAAAGQLLQDQEQQTQGPSSSAAISDCATESFEAADPRSSCGALTLAEKRQRFTAALFCCCVDAITGGPPGGQQGFQQQPQQNQQLRQLREHLRMHDRVREQHEQLLLQQRRRSAASAPGGWPSPDPSAYRPAQSPRSPSGHSGPQSPLQRRPVAAWQQQQQSLPPQLRGGALSPPGSSASLRRAAPAHQPPHGWGAPLLELSSEASLPPSPIRSDARGCGSAAPTAARGPTVVDEVQLRALQSFDFGTHSLPNSSYRLPGDHPLPTPTHSPRRPATERAPLPAAWAGEPATQWPPQGGAAADPLAGRPAWPPWPPPAGAHDAAGGEPQHYRPPTARPGAALLRAQRMLGGGPRSRSASPPQLPQPRRGSAQRQRPVTGWSHLSAYHFEPEQASPQQVPQQQQQQPAVRGPDGSASAGSRSAVRQRPPQPRVSRGAPPSTQRRWR